MESYVCPHSLDAEKANAAVRHRLLRHATRMFRFGEACLVLFLLSWMSARFPLAVKTSADYLRPLCAVVVRPIFVFLVCNAIVVAILFTSERLHRQKIAGVCSEEFVKNSDDTISGYDSAALPREPDEVVYEDKMIICEVSAIPASKPLRCGGEEDASAAADEVWGWPDEKVHLRRSQSEVLNGGCPDEACEMLRRSETAMTYRNNPPEEEWLSPEDELSDEEFQRTIEDFIARQLKFQRDES